MNNPEGLAKAWQTTALLNADLAEAAEARAQELERDLDEAQRMNMRCGLLDLVAAERKIEELEAALREIASPEGRHSKRATDIARRALAIGEAKP